MKNNRSFDEMLFDLSGELVYDLYRENYEKNQPVSVYVPGFQLLLKKSFFKTSLKGPSQKSETSYVVFNKIKDILNFPCKTESKKNFEMAKKIEVACSKKTWFSWQHSWSWNERRRKRMIRKK